MPDKDMYLAGVIDNTSVRQWRLEEPEKSATVSPLGLANSNISHGNYLPVSLSLCVVFKMLVSW